MKNTERQTALDKRKWIESEKEGCDMSGDMPYCEHCEEQTRFRSCVATQEERESVCLCAKAYNRMARGAK